MLCLRLFVSSVNKMTLGNSVKIANSICVISARFAYIIKGRGRGIMCSVMRY